VDGARGDKSHAQYVKALRAVRNESAEADFHVLRREFIPRRIPRLKSCMIESGNKLKCRRKFAKY
jgi:hypothetical protein